MRTRLSSTPAQTPRAVSLHLPLTLRSLPCPTTPRKRIRGHRISLCLQRQPLAPESGPDQGPRPSLRRGPAGGGTSNPSISSSATRPRGFWFTTASWPSCKVRSSASWRGRGPREGRGGARRAGGGEGRCAGSQVVRAPREAAPAEDLQVLAPTLTKWVQTSTF